MDGERILVFSHIPRTGGTTLRGIIERQYGLDAVFTFRGNVGGIADFKELPGTGRARLKVLQGHRPFGLAEELQLAANYITVLRDPVQRVASFYHWIRQDPGNALHSQVRGMKLEDFVTSGLRHSTNQQTEFVSGLADSSNDEALETAKRNLTRSDVAFGLQEQFDESLLIFQRFLRWEDPFYSGKKNATENESARSDLPRATIDLIKEHNRYDLELYRFAKEKFTEIIEAQGLSFRDDLRHFREKNRAFGSL